MAEAAVAHAIGVHGWKHIFAIVLPANSVSIAVLAKLGFLYQGDAEVRSHIIQRHALVR